MLSAAHIFIWIALRFKFGLTSYDDLPPAQNKVVQYTHNFIKYKIESHSEYWCLVIRLLVQI